MNSRTSKPAPTGTYTKLKSGAWGVRVNDVKVKPGNLVKVTKRSGETQHEVVEKVLFTDAAAGVAICAIKPQQRQSASSDRSSSTGRGECAECGRESSNLRGCYDSSGIYGQCCPSCANADPSERSFA